MMRRLLKLPDAVNRFRAYSINSPAPMPMRSRLSDPQTWLERYGDVLYRYALLRLNEPSAAEDAVQETLLAALEARQRYAGNASERTWLIGILKHKIVDQLRKGRRESSDDQATEADTGYPTNQLFDERGRWKAEVSSWSDPDRALEQAQFWDVFNDCIAALPPPTGEDIHPEGGRRPEQRGDL